MGDTVEKLSDEASYKQLFHAYRDEEALPSNEILRKIVDLCRAILFPGYYGNARISKQTIRFHTGVNVETLHALLSRQIYAGLCFADSSCATCPEERISAEAERISETFIAALPRIRALLATDAEATFNGDPAARDPGEVIANASAAVKLAPDEKEAHILLAMALLERNGESDLALAESVLDDFLKKHPSSASGHLLRGVAKIRAKRSGEAATDFAQAAVYFPKQQEELSNRLGVYRKRAYLNKSMEGRIIVNAYRAMMSGSGYFSPDFQLARLLLESGRKEEARRKIFDHFFRRRMQGEWDKVLDDFRFSWRFLNTELFRIDAGAAETLKLSIDSAFFTNSVILKMTNDGKEPLHNVTILLCVRFTDMFKGDYISFPVGETLAVLPPGRSVEIGRRGIGEVSERILGVKKKFKDIIEYAAVVISDETISWIESKTVGDILPDPPEETSVPAKEVQGESKVEAFAEKAGSIMKKTVSGTIRKLRNASGEKQAPAETDP